MPAMSGTNPSTASCGRATRRSRSTMESATATSTPCSTPTTRTAAVVATAIRNSLIRNRASLRNSATSTRRTAAYTTTAPRPRPGRCEHRSRDEHGQQGRDDRDDAGELGAAPDRVTDRGPAPAAADREALQQARPDVGGAQRQQLALGVEPQVLPVRERAAGEHVVGVADEGDAERCRQRRTIPSSETRGSEGTGTPPGIGPITVTPRSSRCSSTTAAAAPSMPISAIGARGNTALPTSITARVTSPSTSVGACTSARSRAADATWGTNPSTSTLMPSSLPSWEAIMIPATPAM